MPGRGGDKVTRGWGHWHTPHHDACLTLASAEPPSAQPWGSVPVSPCSPSAPGLSGGRALPCCQLWSGERGQLAVSRARGRPPAPGTAQRNPCGGDRSALLSRPTSPCSCGLAPLSPQCSEGFYSSGVAAGGTHRATLSARPTQTYTSQRGATMRTASQGPPGSASGPPLRPATSTACSCGEEEDAVPPSP